MPTQSLEPTKMAPKISSTMHAMHALSMQCVLWILCVCVFCSVFIKPKTELQRAVQNKNYSLCILRIVVAIQKSGYKFDKNSTENLIQV